jgi:NADPH-dependent 2,4-dienoyl-CoA reductase/sulfur reductase-like enzyme
MRQVDILVIGGGAAGLSSAVGAYTEGVKDILIVERSDSLGGILRQCIHNGFGLHYFKEDLTGVEFAKRCIDKVKSLGIPYMLNSFVLNISPEMVITILNPEEGLIDIQAKAVILAMGCRERTRNSMLIPGIRGAGIMTAGTAQRYLNLEGYLPGKHIVILGSGDIGLIMARQFIIEGAKVEAVVEIMPYSGGLARNIAQCLDDFNIPLYYNSTVTDIIGAGRSVKAVKISEVDSNFQPVDGTEREVPCDTLIISAGLIPENELTREAGIELSSATKGAIVSDDFQTMKPGVFACGNVLHVHDLVDFVCEESETAGRNAARFAKGELPERSNEEMLPVIDGDGVVGCVPNYIRLNSFENNVRIMFRTRRIYKNCHICIDADNRTILRRKRMILTPGEMCELELSLSLLSQISSGITVRVEE